MIMKLMNIILLCGLMRNAYPIVMQVDLLRIKTIWNYFSPDGKKLINTCINDFINTTREIKNENDDNIAVSLNKIDSKLLFLFMDKDDQSILSLEKQAELKQIEDEWNKLVNKEFTHEQCCNRIFDKILTKNGCALPLEKRPSKDDMKQLLDALLQQKLLNDTFKE